MIAGTLKERIVVMRLQKTSNYTHEQEDIYIPFYDTRADIKPINTARTEELNEILYPFSYSCRIRDYVPVNEYDHILWRCQEFKITNILIEPITHSILLTLEKVHE